MQLAYKHSDFATTFNTLTAMGSHQQNLGKNVELAETYFLQALEMAQRDLGGLNWRDLAAAYSNLGYFNYNI